jgi:hypothetical protein
MDPIPTPDITPTPPPATGGPFHGARRSIAMAALAVGLLVVGGSAVAFAADPSPIQAPAATTAPTTGAGGTTTPGTTAPNGAIPVAPGRGGHHGDGDCPADAGSGSTGTSGTSGGTTAPAPTTVPAPSVDASDV